MKRLIAIVAIVSCLVLVDQAAAQCANCTPKDVPATADAHHDEVKYVWVRKRGPLRRLFGCRRYVLRPVYPVKSVTPIGVIK